MSAITLLLTLMVVIASPSSFGGPFERCSALKQDIEVIDFTFSDSSESFANVVLLESGKKRNLHCQVNPPSSQGPSLFAICSGRAVTQYRIAQLRIHALPTESRPGAAVLGFELNSNKPNIDEVIPLICE